MNTHKHHYPKSTVEADEWCNACGKQTRHAVTDGRASHCLACLARRASESAAERAERERVAAQVVAPELKQAGLFDATR